jgi:uncharacterized MAPEG superfamily protein
MSIELWWLGWSIVLGLVYILIAAAISTWQRGIFWNAGNRDGDPQPLNKYAARADRASKNFLETFVFFAAASLAVVVAGKHGAQTAIAAQIYFWARVVYLPVYIVGIPYLRTAIWIASLWGIVQMLEALLQ